MRKNNEPTFPKVESEFFTPKGGLDLVTPPLQLRPGAARDAENFEVSITGGYARIGGYERWDGGATPSELTYAVMTLAAHSTAVIHGSKMIGETSRATCTYVSPPDLTGFSPPTPTEAYVANVNGQFIDGENIYDGYNQLVGECVIAPVGLTGDTPRELAELTKNAQDGWRQKTNAPDNTATMTGPVVGLARYQEQTWAFRRNRVDDNVSAVRAELASAFNPDYWWWDGNEHGPWASLTIPYSLGGTPCRIDTATHNFGGAAGAEVLIGITRTSKAFKYDGTTWSFITTGMSPDVPTQLCVHRNRLFLAFGASLQFSEVGDPTVWTPVLGAGELALGDTITGLMPHVGSPDSPALLVFTTRTVYVLYGNEESDYKLVQFNQTLGAEPYTAQFIGQPFFMNDLGVSTLSASQSFGSFAMGTVTQQIQPFINAKRGLATASCIVRTKNQYRIYFSDRTGLHLTINGGKLTGVMPIRLGFVVNCVISYVENGTETVLAGGDDGWVYKMDSGQNFDGEPIYAYLSMAFNHIRSPRFLKSYRRCVLELKADGYADFEAGIDLSYGTANLGVTPNLSQETPVNAAVWDDFTWDDFYWDGQALTPASLAVDGTGSNVSVRLLSNSEIAQPFELTGVILDYIVRRGARGT